MSTYTAATSPFSFSRYISYHQNEPILDVARGYDVAASIYDDRSHWNRFWEINEQPRVLDCCDRYLQHAGWAVDIGCGTGTLVRSLRGKGFRTYGIDPSSQMLKKAEDKLQSAEGLFLGDASSLPFFDASIDLAIAARVFAHAPDLEKVFDEVARVLRPGGILIFTDIYQRTKPATIYKEGVEISISTHLRDYNEVQAIAQRSTELKLIEAQMLTPEELLRPEGDELFFEFLDRLTQPAYSYLVVMRRIDNKEV